MRGDTLFGQLCWALRLRSGPAALTEALAGYGTGRPFAVISDAMPAGFLPKPDIPPPTPVDDDADWQARKAWGRRRWVPRAAFSSRLIDALSDRLLASPASFETGLQSHNTINRLTGTTGQGEFAPFQAMRLLVTDANRRVDLVGIVDETRIAPQVFVDLIRDVGLGGFGRDASIGLGLFDLDGVDERAVEVVPAGRPVVTLAPAAFQARSLDPERSHWRVFTRFGRHGGAAGGGAVFKTPVLLADTGALVTPTRAVAQGFVGRGLGGDGRLSRRIPETVHQGFAPVIPVDLEGWT